MSFCLSVVKHKLEVEEMAQNLIAPTNFAKDPSSMNSPQMAAHKSLLLHSQEIQCPFLVSVGTLYT